MELPSIHAVTKLTCMCCVICFCLNYCTFATDQIVSCYHISIRVNHQHLYARVTGTLAGTFVRWSSLEGQQDFSGGSRVKDRVTFWDRDVHELRWTPRSSRVKHFKSNMITWGVKKKEKELKVITTNKHLPGSWMLFLLKSSQSWTQDSSDEYLYMLLV